MFRFQDQRLEEIASKVLAGTRLSFDDGMVLATTYDLLGLGQLANYVREKLHGDITYYNVNRHLNPTNVCVASCALCAFAEKYGGSRGWTYTVEEAVEVAAADVDETVSELHIVGGLHPKLGVEYYEALFRALKARFPWVHIKALTMVELDFLSHRAKLPVEQVVLRLKEAGLDSCPGGGAEIFAPEVRAVICDHKTSGERWLEVARTVHRLGIRSNCTMLYGHVEKPEHRVDHLLKLRQLQDETGGFQCFIPLAFHPANTRLAHLPGPTGRLDLQTIALSRLLLDNIPHIKAYWIMLGAKTAQVALHFGANDLDGTVVDERITYAAGGQAGKGMPRAELERLIREARRTPVERDTLYRPRTPIPRPKPVVRESTLPYWSS
ncbi:MAG: aminofutalosine synthase MqnE [Thermoanaerobaculum sp.]|nr:aminofutalosine synthase MqnE [Thermoanaerobaculum sp.]MCX7895288.1 aminofutalosine synthase MqnE [Thermoanaerobaculum sp.]MDW7967705.1 aminofutalosine synthase MqnE [Thermoanaerobaculum sp.]